MKSYAAVDRIGINYVVCEVEILETENSDSEDYYNHEVKMMEISVSLIEEAVEILGENDILVVEHDGKTVSKVYGKSQEEKARRDVVYDKIINS